MKHETLRKQHLVPKHQSVAGMGLTTLKRLQPHEILGVSHIEDSRFEDGFIRTYLGSLINHSDEPNCRYIEVPSLRYEIASTILYLATIEDIHPGEELLVRYGRVKEL